MQSVSRDNLPSNAFDCAYLNLCFIDADAHQCRFPLMLETLQTEQAQVSNRENVLFLVNYSMASQQVREAITALFAEALRSGALVDLHVIHHQEVAHREDKDCFANLPIAPGDGGLASLLSGAKPRSTVHTPEPPSPIEP